MHVERGTEMIEGDLQVTGAGNVQVGGAYDGRGGGERVQHRDRDTTING